MFFQVFPTCDIHGAFQSNFRDLTTESDDLQSMRFKELHLEMLPRTAEEKWRDRTTAEVSARAAAPSARVWVLENERNQSKKQMKKKAKHGSFGEQKARATRLPVQNARARVLRGFTRSRPQCSRNSHTS